MVKKVLIFIIFLNFLNANIYKNSCVACHSKYPVKLDKFFYRYLLKYSSEREVKKALNNYLKNPTLKETIMPEGFINRFGVKDRSKLNNKELKEVIDIYWDTYKIFGKLR